MMDGLTLFGLILGMLAIAGGHYLEGGQLEALVNYPALLIVLGGTIGAVMLQTPFATFLRAFKIMWWIIKPPKIDFEARIKEFVLWNKRVRQSGLISLEDDASRIKDKLLKKGVEMLVSGSDQSSLRKMMEIEIDTNEMRDAQAAKVFESMGGYSPTIGILGAVLGLMQVLGNLSDPSELGAGIAVAFVATVYGVGFANLLFLPIARKIKVHVNQYIRLHEMYLEGLTSISRGENPRLMEMKLKSYISSKRDPYA